MLSESGSLRIFMMRERRPGQWSGGDFRAGPGGWEQTDLCQ